MGKNDKRNRRKNAVIIIIFTFTFLSILSANLIFFFSIKKENKKYSALLKDNTVESNNIKEINDEIKELSNKIKDIENIDLKIKESRTNYYKSLKSFEDKVYNNEIKYKIAYLTFDDGPYYTSYKFLDVLDKYNIKATFFTIGAGKTTCFDNSKFDCTKIYAEESKRGHTIANHTFSHAIFYGLYSSTNSFMMQIQKQEDLIKEKTGQTPNIVRFPGGSSTAGKLKTSIITELRKKGYGWVDWTAQDGDGGDLNDKTTAMKNFTSSINDNIEVVLFHDYSDITLSILPDAIEYLQQKGYVLLPLFYESRMVNK